MRFYDGNQWSGQPGGFGGLNGVSAVDPTHVWAVGDGGTILFYDGTSWSVQASGLTGDLVSVSAISWNHVWAVGQYGNILFFDGTSWTLQRGGADPAFYLRGVSALDPTHVWAVGDDSGGVATILFFDGTSWSTQDPGVDTHLFGASAFGSYNVLTVGDGGTILRGIPTEHPVWVPRRGLCLLGVHFVYQRRKPERHGRKRRPGDSAALRPGNGIPAVRPGDESRHPQPGGRHGVERFLGKADLPRGKDHSG